MGNSAESKFRQLCKEQGYWSFKKGWPDFLVITPDNELVFVEVKSPDDILSSAQFQVLCYLSQLAKVYIWTPPPNWNAPLTLENVFSNIYSSECLNLAVCDALKKTSPIYKKVKTHKIWSEPF